jgi:hypothetical protein
MPPEEQNFFDKLYGQNVAIPIVIAVCTTGCCLIGLIMSILAMVQCKTPQGKANGKLATMISGGMLALYILLGCVWGILQALVFGKS